MTVGDTRSLFGRILVVVAREDDETACSVLLQRAHEARVVFATDRAPASEFFWRGYGSRQQYAAVRHGKPETFTFLGFTHFSGQRNRNGAFIVLADYGEEANGREAQSRQGWASTPEASSYGRGRCMASQGCAAVLPIFRPSRLLLVADRSS